jgi:hypothetical protein
MHRSKHWIITSPGVCFSTTYHSQINLDGCSDPEWVRVPGLIVFSEQAAVDVPGSDHACNSDDETKAEQQSNGESLSSRHVQLQTISGRSDKVSRHIDPH